MKLPVFYVITISIILLFLASMAPSSTAAMPIRPYTYTPSGWTSTPTRTVTFTPTVTHTPTGTATATATATSTPYTHHDSHRAAYGHANGNAAAGADRNLPELRHMHADEYGDRYARAAGADPAVPAGRAEQ